VLDGDTVRLLPPGEYVDPSVPVMRTPTVLETLHCRVVLWPAFMAPGEAVNELTAGTSAMLTVTVAVFGVHPVLAAVKVYVVGDEGETTSEPEPDV
jgi:hypothetical protein